MPKFFHRTVNYIPCHRLFIFRERTDFIESDLTERYVSIGHVAEKL